MCQEVSVFHLTRNHVEWRSTDIDWKLCKNGYLQEDLPVSKFHGRERTALSPRRKSVILFFHQTKLRKKLQ